MSTVVTCPSCTQPLVSVAGRCERCALPLTGALAARLWQVDQQIAALTSERATLLDRLRHTSGPEGASDIGNEAVALGVALPGRQPSRQPRSSWTGQQLLLGAGVLLVLVACVVFLAVAWALIGVGGQVLVMAGLTTAACGVALRLSRRDLGSTAEAVGALGAGLAVLDACAARSLNLVGLGHMDSAGYTLLVSLALAAGWAALAVREGAPRVFAGAAIAAAAVASAAGLVTVVPDVDRFTVAAVAWLLATASCFAVVGERSDGVWRSVLWAHRVVAVCYSAAGLLVALPAVFVGDLAGTGGGCAALTLATVAALTWLGRRGSIRATPLAPVSAAVSVVIASVTLIGVATHGHGLGLTALALAAAGASAFTALTTSGERVASSARLAVLAGAHLSAAGAAAMLATEAFDSATGNLTSMLALSLAAIAAAATFTARTTTVVRVREVGVGYAALSALASAGLATSGFGDVVETAALMLTVLVLVAAAGWRRGRPEEALLGAAACVGVFASFAVAADAGSAVVMAAVLASAGLCALVYSVLPGRGAFALAGVVSCSASTWTLSASHDVHLIEAYSLPLAALAALVGLVRLRREPGAPSWATIGPAISAALLPSALACVTSADLLRPMLVLLVSGSCLAAGAWWRWQAPLLTGAVAVVVVAMSQLAPYAVGMPRWLTLGAVGLALLLVGARYEQRRRDAEVAVAWVRALR